MINFLNLKINNKQYEKEFKEAASRVIESGWYLMGEELNIFEKNYAAFCKVDHCLGVANGLDALRLIFKAYNLMGIIKKGDDNENTDLTAVTHLHQHERNPKDPRKRHPNVLRERTTQEQKQQPPHGHG